MTNKFFDVPNYEGRYLVDREGNIYSCFDNFGKIRDNPLKLNPAKRGHTNNYYSVVNLYLNKKPTPHSVHRIVAKVFIPNPHNLPFVNHKDENTFNNNVSNLEWCTPQYNQEYSLSKKVYSFISPNQEIMHIKNLRKFSRENQLNHAHMYQVQKGTVKQYRGWTKFNEIT